MYPPFRQSLTPTSPASASPVRSRTVLVGVAVLGTGLAVGTIVAPSPLIPDAAAHDVLESSSPDSGAELSEAPDEIELTFSAPILEAGNLVSVVGMDGQVAAEGEPEVAEEVVTLALPEDLPAGEYEATWRVTSSDGHPISGVVDFTLAEGAGGADEESAASTDASQSPASQDNSESSEPAEPTAEAQDESEPTAEAQDESEPTAEAQDESGFNWTYALLGIAVLGAAGLIWWWSKRRSQ